MHNLNGVMLIEEEMDANFIAGIPDNLHRMFYSSGRNAKRDILRNLTSPGDFQSRSIGGKIDYFTLDDVRFTGDETCVVGGPNSFR